jgi:beta-phosphoglucomutase-like phosphatase (HAD superfamily)
MGLAAILDVDGTLVDTNYHPAIAWFRAFRDQGVTLPVWRIHRHMGMGGDQLVAVMIGDSTTGAYSQFGAHALAALEMLADQTGIELADGDRQAISGQMRRLPAHPEVPAALERLRGTGFQLAALTNSTLEVADLIIAADR